MEDKLKPTMAGILAVFMRDAARLGVANCERGDAWRALGAMGLFLEVRTMYLRLRGLFWDNLAPGVTFDQMPHGAILNALTDLKCYAALMQLALEENNLTGDGSVESSDGYLAFNPAAHEPEGG